MEEKADSSRALFKTFEHLGVLVEHPKGTVLFDQGAAVHSIYVVRRGQIKLTCRTADDGRLMILRIAKAGDILGISAVLNGSGHELTAETLMPCTLLHLSGPVFMESLSLFASSGMQALRALARDHQEIFLSARRLALFPLASSRIAQVLIGFSDADLSDATQSSGFLMLLSHAELANLIGTSRETVTRLMNDLERKKIIARDQDWVRILKPAKLAQLAN